MIELAAKNYNIVEDLEVAKPFLKWAGGKSQLLKNFNLYYPKFDLKLKKYVEPFVGAGAVLFDLLSKFTFEEIYISDMNKELINTYINIRDNPNQLIVILNKLEIEYKKLNNEHRKIYYLNKRDDYNKLIINTNKSTNIKKAALMMFLNKTCFNGLYRVNRKGMFNVPIGSYKNPKICDIKNILAVSNKLKNVKIHCDDYKKSYDFIDETTFVYLDPPYRPLNKTSSFTSYTENDFDDKKQIELAEFVNKINKKGCKFMLSNSDPKNIDPKDNFFDDLYKDYDIIRIDASRMINSKASNRGRIKELLIKNY